MRRTELATGAEHAEAERRAVGLGSRRLSQLEAAEVLGMSERTFRRWSRRF